MQLKIVFEDLIDHDVMINLKLKSNIEDWNTDNFSFRLPKSVKVLNSLDNNFCPYAKSQ